MQARITARSELDVKQLRVLLVLRRNAVTTPSIVAGSHTVHVGGDRRPRAYHDLAGLILWPPKLMGYKD
jgi:hypothetical protein